MNSLRSISRPIRSSIYNISVPKIITECKAETPGAAPISTVRVKNLKKFYERNIHSRNSSSIEQSSQSIRNRVYIDSYSSSLKVQALIQLYEYGQLMRKDVPSSLLSSERNMSIRFYSKEGYPWNTICEHVRDELFEEEEEEQQQQQSCRSTRKRKSQTKCLEEPKSKAAKSSCSAKKECNSENETDDGAQGRCSKPEDSNNCKRVKCKKSNDKGYGMSSESSYRFSPPKEDSSSEEYQNRCEKLQRLNKKDVTCNICLDKSFDDCSIEKPTNMTKESNACRSVCKAKEEASESCSEKSVTHTKFAGCLGNEKSETDSCGKRGKRENPCGQPDSVNLSEEAVRKVNSCGSGSRNRNKKSRKSRGSKFKRINIMKPNKKNCARLARRNPCGSPKKADAKHRKKAACSSRSKQRSKSNQNRCGKQKPKKCDSKPKCYEAIQRSAQKRKGTPKKKGQAKVMKMYRRGPKRKEAEAFRDYPWDTVKVARPYDESQSDDRKKEKQCAQPFFKVKKKRGIDKPPRACKTASVHGGSQIDLNPSSKHNRYPWNTEACNPPVEECSPIPKKKPSIKLLKKIAQRNRKQLEEERSCS